VSRSSRLHMCLMNIDPTTIKNLPKHELILEIEKTKSSVTTGLNQLEEEKLDKKLSPRSL
ncbi:MAG: hypothetical protein NWS46_05310, partial [Cyclobacteriaceae bacterium]|nr:hypothetical protein [Cyclobacteriaceae bacterium]